VRETVAAMEDFAAFTGQERYDPSITPAGLLSLTTTQDGAAAQAETVAHQRSIGVDGIELLDGDEVRARFPFLAPEIVSARFRQGDGLLDQRQLALGLLAGTEVITRCRVTGFDGLTVRTTLGPIAAGACVIACGPMSGKVAALAGVELPIETFLRHKVVLPDVPAVPPSAPLVFDEDTGAHWRPALRGAYALISLSGQEPCTPVDDPVTEADFAYQVLDPSSPTSIARLAPFWREVWEDARAAWTVQCGLYTVTPDHRPLIDATPVPGLYVNTGYSGHGVMCSVGGGRLMVERLQGGATPFALDRAFVTPKWRTR
jgi:sarcosine oxidase subunit beta